MAEGCRSIASSGGLLLVVSAVVCVMIPHSGPADPILSNCSEVSAGCWVKGRHIDDPHGPTHHRDGNGWIGGVGAGRAKTRPSSGCSSPDPARRVRGKGEGDTKLRLLFHKTFRSVYSCVSAAASLHVFQRGRATDPVGKRLSKSQQTNIKLGFLGSGS